MRRLKDWAAAVWLAVITVVGIGLVIESARERWLAQSEGSRQATISLVVALAAATVFVALSNWALGRWDARHDPDRFEDNADVINLEDHRP